ncbi:MAG: TIGR01777 family oxidoreductase [Chloroflexota bacterium]
MRIVIPGGSGLIGRVLASKLAEKGYEVIILSRSPEKVHDLPNGVSAKSWDGSTAEGWGHLADGAKAIINLAGAGIGDARWTDARKQIILDSRLESTQAVVSAIEEAKVKPEVLIQGSAVGFYGDRGDEELTEDSASGSNYLADVTVAWEKAAVPVEEHTRVVYIRTGVVLTTKGGAFPKMLLQFNLFAGGPYGNGGMWFPWIHIDDEVRAIIWLVENDAISGPINLSSPSVVRNRTFARTLGKVLGRPAFIPAPAIALKTALGEMAILLLASQRVSADKLVEAGFEFKYEQPLRALKDVVYSEK